MSEAILDPLEDVIRKAGEDWLIDWYAPKEQALPNLRRALAAADARARERLGANAPALTPASLAAEYGRNPHKVRALLQILPSVASPDMLVMAWRIMQGMNIDSVRMEYEQEQSFRLRVRLASTDDDDEKEEYETTDIDDAVVLRHIGIMKMGDAPAFDGFYPLNVGK